MIYDKIKEKQRSMRTGKINEVMKEGKLEG